jgi:pimeloyl-ACP methyl ester carboxylesterase
VSLLILVLAVAGVVYEQVEETVIAKRNPPCGTLIDMGGRRMHLYCIGQGPVTVVFDSGLGGYSNDWSDVQPEVAKFNPANADHSSCGALAWGLNSQLYALEFPNQVVGMVLVDSGHPEQWERLPPSPWDQRVVPNVTRMRRLVPLGISRLLGACLDDNDAPISNCGRRLDTIRAEFVSVVAGTHQVQDAFGTSLHSATGTTPPFGAKPLMVLSRDPSWGRLVDGTVIVTEDGIVHFCDDIYGHDAAFEKVLVKGYPYPG